MKPYYDEGGITIYHGDCRDILPMLDPTVDLVLTDPPYGITDHAWDVVVPSRDWMIAPCVTFAAEPFATRLIVESPLCFAYDLVWVKNTATNHFNAARMPLRKHERILVFGETSYNPILVRRTVAEMSRLNKQQRQQHPFKFPGTVLEFSAVNNRNGDRTEHPSQKPVDLLRWLVCSYSVPSDVILDPFMGSGSTLRAAKDCGRSAVGVEVEERYCEIAAKRLAQAQEVLDLGMVG